MLKDMIIKMGNARVSSVWLTERGSKTSDLYIIQEQIKTEPQNNLQCKIHGFLNVLAYSDPVNINNIGEILSSTVTAYACE